MRVEARAAASKASTATAGRGPSAVSISPSNTATARVGRGLIFATVAAACSGSRSGCSHMPRWPSAVTARIVGANTGCRPSVSNTCSTARLISGSSSPPGGVGVGPVGVGVLMGPRLPALSDGAHPRLA